MYVLGENYHHHSWQYSRRDSETNITDPVLKTYLARIQTAMIFERQQQLSVQLNTGKLKFKTYLASATSQPEHRIEWNQFILIASESKGIDASYYTCLIQGMQAGGDSAIHLSRYLDIDKVVFPVIFSYGGLLQIFAVYLIDGPFPVIVRLSDPISYATHSGKLMLACWTKVLTSFTLDTIDMLQTKQSLPLQFENIGLSFKYFFKPILDFQNNCDLNYDYLNYGSRKINSLESMMSVYKRLSNVIDSDNYILYPVGMLSYPSSDSFFFQDIKDSLKKFFATHFEFKFQDMNSGCPVVVFPMLNNQWQITKPPQRLFKSYLYGVATSVKIMNEALVAHCDLRSPNVMWKEEINNTVSIRIIDFEDAVLIGSYFKPLSAHKDDKRYPFLDITTPVKITTFHNYWFLVALERWIYSPLKRFGDVMFQEDYEVMKLYAEKLASNENFDPQNYVNSLEIDIDDINLEENMKNLNI